MFWRFNDVAPHGDVGAARCSWWRHLFCNSGGEQPHGTNGVQILSVSGASDLPLGMGLGWSISWGISGQSSSEAKGLRRCCSKGAEEVWPRECFCLSSTRVQLCHSQSWEKQLRPRVPQQIPSACLYPKHSCLTEIRMQVLLLGYVQIHINFQADLILKNKKSC